MRRWWIGLMSAAALWAGANDSFLLRNVTVHPVTGPEVAAGMVLVKDGVIAEVGTKVVAPKGVRVVDGKGLHAYPGMIDSATTIGLKEIGAVRETVDTVEIGEFNPELRAVIAVNPESEHINVARANGLTTVVTMPEGAGLSGQLALIHLAGWTWEEMAVMQSGALVMRMPTVVTRSFSFTEGSRTTPYREAKKTYDEKMQKLHDYFEQARRYKVMRASAAAGSSRDLKLEAMQPVIDGKLPLMVIASREREVRDALKFAEREKIKIILAGVREPGAEMANIKKAGVPVILGETLELPLEDDAAYDSQYALPVEFAKAGVKFAFGTFNSSASRNLPYQAGAAVAFGLSKDDALKAVTINAAEIWGVSDKVGSLEKGKWADMILTDGDPLETRTQIKQMFIRGTEVNLEDNKHFKLYKKYMGRP